jgi:hypothetical protein
MTTKEFAIKVSEAALHQDALSIYQFIIPNLSIIAELLLLDEKYMGTRLSLGEQEKRQEIVDKRRKRPVIPANAKDVTYLQAW